MAMARDNGDGQRSQQWPGITVMAKEMMITLGNEMMITLGSKMVMITAGNEMVMITHA